MCAKQEPRQVRRVVCLYGCFQITRERARKPKSRERYNVRNIVKEKRNIKETLV